VYVGRYMKKQNKKAGQSRLCPIHLTPRHYTLHPVLYAPRSAPTPHVQPLHLVFDPYASRSAPTPHVRPLHLTFGPYTSRPAATPHVQLLRFTFSCSFHFAFVLVAGGVVFCAPVALVYLVCHLGCSLFAPWPVLVVRRV
jgi:hypothetical protein